MSESSAIAPVNVQALMQSALDKGSDGVAALERLVALHGQLKADAAREAFFDALSRFQGECVSIHKNRRAKIQSRSGGEYGYSFADLDQIVRQTRPILQKHGLSVTFDSVVEGGAMHTTCTLRHVQGHYEQSKFSCPIGSSNPGMSDQQKFGGAYTFSRRYALIGVLGLATTDDDTDGAEPEVPEAVDVIGDEEAARLQAYAESIGPGVVGGMLRYFKVERLDLLPKSRLKEARDGLDKKAQAARGGK